MAVAITAPAAGAQMSVGSPVPVVTGTGFGVTAACTVRYWQDQMTADVTLPVTSDAGGNITSAAKLTLIPLAPGILNITATDAGGNSITTQVQVFSSHGG
jgi:hypothetical protein